MPRKVYKKRILDQLLAERLEEVGAVLIEGPKWCGKTTTALQHARSKIMLANPDELKQSKSMLSASASYLLNGIRHVCLMSGRLFQSCGIIFVMK